MVTMMTYHVYPMKSYCTRAVQLAREHGLIPVGDNCSNRVLEDTARKLADPQH